MQLAGDAHQPFRHFSGNRGISPGPFHCTLRHFFSSFPTGNIGKDSAFPMFIKWDFLVQKLHETSTPNGPDKMLHFINPLFTQIF